MNQEQDLQPEHHIQNPDDEVTESKEHELNNEEEGNSYFPEGVKINGEEDLDVDEGQDNSDEQEDDDFDGYEIICRTQYENITET